MEKHSVSRLSYLFAHLHLLSSDLFSSDSSHLCFSTVHIVGSFTSKLPSIIFSPPALAKSSELAAVALFKILGWLFAGEGRKCKPFDETCEALGVVFGMSDSDKFLCKVANTASRIEEVSSEI